MSSVAEVIHRRGLRSCSADNVDGVDRAQRMPRSACGRLPKRYGHSGHCVIGHNRTSCRLPPEQSKHLARMAWRGVSRFCSGGLASLATEGLGGTLAAAGLPGGAVGRSSAASEKVEHAGTLLGSVCI